MRRKSRVIVGVFAAGLLSLAAGCMSLTPYEQVRANEPAEEFVQIDGQWVHFQRSGSGPALLLIHGFGESTYTWRQVMPALAADFDVIAVDLNGFGYTERPESAGAYALAGQVELVKRLMDALGVSEATVVGHSYGAGVALGLATRYPQRVQRIVLSDGGVIEQASSGFLVRPLVAPFLGIYVKLFLLNEDTVRDLLAAASVVDDYITDEVVAEYLDRVRVEGVDFTVRGLTSTATDVLEIEPAGIHQPVLLVWGAEDTVIPLAVGEDLAAALPDARLVTIPATGHLPMEERPAAFLAALQDFLTGP